MGQYYKPISIDAKQYLDGHNIGKTLGCGFQGLKLMEHSWLLNDMVNAALFLLSEGQPWNKTKIVWCGDYADARDDLFIPADDCSTKKEEANYYAYASHAFEENPVSKTVKTSRMKVKGTDETVEVVKGYILNHDTKEYVCLQDTPSSIAAWMGGEPEWKVHPLPLLTCDGNGLGGGDFNGQDPNGLVGKWAYNRISYQTRKPLKAEGFTKLIFDLKEE